MAKLHIFVPLGREASRSDQIENADYFVKKGYAVKLEEKQLTLEGLEASVEQVLRDKESYYQAMKNSHEIKSVEDFMLVLKKILTKEKMTTKDKGDQKELLKIFICMAKASSGVLRKKISRKASETDEEEHKDETLQN